MHCRQARRRQDTLDSKLQYSCADSLAVSTAAATAHDARPFQNEIYTHNLLNTLGAMVLRMVKGTFVKSFSRE